MLKNYLRKRKYIKLYDFTGLIFKYIQQPQD